MRSLLVGEYRHILDEKKRISLPKAFREALGKRLVITRGLDNCLVVYSRQGWEAMARRLQGLSYTQAETRAFARFMLSGAAEVEVDQVGRILIPEHQKEYAGLDTQVVFTGVSDRVEVWDADVWRLYKRRIDRGAETLAKKLGEIGAL